MSRGDRFEHSELEMHFLGRRTNCKGDGQCRGRYDDETDIEMDEIERDDADLKTDDGWDVRAGGGSVGQGEAFGLEGQDRI